jgi:hypothetical protein
MKETAKIQGNIDENVCFQFCEKLLNTTNINELDLEWNLNNYTDTSITLDKLGTNIKSNKKL